MASPAHNNVLEKKCSLFINGIKGDFSKERDKIRAIFEKDKRRQQAGLACAQSLAALLDKTLILIFKRMADKTEKDFIPAIVATGGYGRGEMAPFSDVDILFLLPDKTSAKTNAVIEETLSAIWALGLKTGHASRTVGDCIIMAEKDVTIATALLEHRFIIGNKKLFEDFRTRFKAGFHYPKGSSFIAAKLTERDRRHEKMGNSRYRLEPNIKENKGGLRDLQTLFWISAYLYGTQDPAELVKNGVLTASEDDVFKKAHNFLWVVRCHLHYLAARAEDRLTFDVQPEMARRLRYADRAGQKGVERFMKHYFLVARDVGYLTLAICTALEEAGAGGGATKGSRLLLSQYDTAPFIIKGNRLTIPSAGHFRSNPSDMIGIFRVSQTTGLGLHAEALRSLLASRKHLTDKTRNDKNANRLFLEILLEQKGGAETLRRMNEAGILGLFIPDFGRIAAHMQYDMYHTFTADEHTLQAVSLLHSLENGDLAGEAPLASGLFPNIKSRRALYVAMFLHDIAKGRGGDHHALGEKVAFALGPRLGLTAEETETTAWLVRHHLTMSEFSSKRDLGDPKTAEDFVAIVRSPERLRLLTILTTADIMAVGEKRWNSWKSSVISELYIRAMELLTGSPKNRDDSQRVRGVQEKINAAIDGRADMQRFIERTTPYYWLSLPPETIVRHALLLENGAETKIDVFESSKSDTTEITIATPDRKGLFAQLTGALAATGANIAEARIFTLKDGTALDVFQIQGLDGKPYEDRARLKKTLKAALGGKLDVEKELSGRKRPLQNRLRHVKVIPRVIIDNQASVSNTVIEINGKDRPGLLYTLARTLSGLGLQISAAKIATYGSLAVDVFYIRDGFGLKILTPAALARIENALLEALDDQ